MAYITSLYNVGCLPVMFIATALSSKINYFWVLCIPIGVNIINMVLIPVICITLQGKDLAFILVIIVSIICGVCTGLLNTAGFGLAAVFSPKHTAGVMIGQGIVGLISIIPLILHLSIKGDNSKIVGIGFFSFSALINILAIVCILLLKVIPYSKHVLRRAGLMGKSKAKDEGHLPLLSNEGAEVSSINAALIDEKDDLTPERSDSLSEAQLAPKKMSVCQMIKTFMLSLLHIAKKKAWWGIAVMHNYFWTLLAYPSVVLRTPPTVEVFKKDDWGKSLWTVCFIFIYI